MEEGERGAGSQGMTHENPPAANLLHGAKRGGWRLPSRGESSSQAQNGAERGRRCGRQHQGELCNRVLDGTRRLFVLREDDERTTSASKLTRIPSPSFRFVRAGGMPLSSAQWHGVREGRQVSAICRARTKNAGRCRRRQTATRGGVVVFRRCATTLFSSMPADAELRAD